MTTAQRLGAVVVAILAIVFSRAPAVVRLLNPVMVRFLATRLPAGPNVLLGVRGRRSGLVRSVAVTMLDLGERSIVQSQSEEEDWVKNLRAAKEAVVTRRGRTERFDARELEPEAAGRLLHDLLAP